MVQKAADPSKATRVDCAEKVIKLGLVEADKNVIVGAAIGVPLKLVPAVSVPMEMFSLKILLNDN